MNDTEAPAVARATAAQAILDRGWDKAPRTISVRSLDDMTDDELDAYIVEIERGLYGDEQSGDATADENQEPERARRRKAA